jgi:hypothetical protein
MSIEAGNSLRVVQLLDVETIDPNAHKSASPAFKQITNPGAPNRSKISVNQPIFASNLHPKL